ncbi:helix-turn-helix transcriptional regulator [Pedobacter sp. HDW13]|uniref:helix-turn-helix domain-containing protein n=1 Tax=Pedobacter sp. HDW13 TaxID=2714940 RepID=UPI00140C29F4|nr:helix-turn-helix transcriptional regulator [Pedobacter sp. HDW13]QIL40991.1 helix-turn-helix transcriptional regulator [Pedobacter sp. HDW13]
MHPLEAYRLQNNLSQKELADLIEVDKGNLSKIISGKSGISADVSYRIKKALGLDIEPSNHKKTKQVPKPTANAKHLAEIHYPLEPNSESPYIDLGDGNYLMLVPLVQEYAYAGYLGNYQDVEYVEELPKHAINVFKHHRGLYRAFEVLGDSMDNGTSESILEGNIVTGSYLQRHHWTSKLHTHRVDNWIIVHKKLGIIVKRIHHKDIEQGIITIKSLNPNKDLYPDEDLLLDDVKELYSVINISKPTRRNAR